MSGSRMCNYCGSSEIDTDAGRGVAACTSCGSVLEENVIVSEVQFEENAHGGSSAIGQFVSTESRGGGTNTIPGFRFGDRTASTEITLNNAKTRISTLASQLRMNKQCISIAFNFFKMALNYRLTKGRRSNHVAAACLYMTSRIERTPHMLIDFSDAIQVDPFVLGRTYMKLANSLSINLPVLDPCLYILRFASKLEFGDKTHEVYLTALRVVQRMKKDWIDTGRRPAGLCGAALLIASRLHDFSRTIKDIVKVVRIQQSTLKKRLLEFGETPSGSLTSHKFMQIDLEEEQDPPCLQTARKKDKEKLEKFCAQESDVKEFLSLSVEIDKALEKKERGGTINRKRNISKQKKNVTKGELPNEDEITRLFIAQQSINMASEDDNVKEKPRSTKKFLMPTTYFNSEDNETSSNQREKAKETFDSETVDETPIDDDEIDGYILSETEVNIKTKAWMEMNGEYLKEQEEKRMKREQEMEGKVVKKRKRKKRTHFEAHSTAEAIEKMLSEKTLSNKINYEVLRILNNTAQDAKQEVREGNPTNIKEPVKVHKQQITSEVTEAPEKDDVGEEVAATQEKKRLKIEEEVQANNYKGIAEVTEAQEDGVEDFWKDEVAINQEEKQPNINEPVQRDKYQGVDTFTQEQEDDNIEEYWEDEDEEEPMSAAQLLAQHMEEFEYL